MPQFDAHHDSVKRALEKDGWRITDDPLVLEYKDIVLFAGLGAEKTIAAERDGRRIAVEIKVFGGASLASELQKAKGQYDFYRFILQRTEPERELFLAIATEVWQSFFQRPSIRDFIADQQVKLLVFNPDSEEIVQWL